MILAELSKSDTTALEVRNLLRLIEESWFEKASSTPELTLPPLQRNGVWRARQILDLWRSVLDGLPIGLFYVRRGLAQRDIVGLRDVSSLKAEADGFDLLDGQQRLRALALGVGDPLDEGRCLWIKFNANDYEIIMTSRNQPFGYTREGEKLKSQDRRRAREAYDHGTKLRFVGQPPPGRSSGKVFDFDLYDREVTTEDGTRLACPPYPKDSTESDTVRLSTFLKSDSPSITSNLDAYLDRFPASVRKFRQDLERIDRGKTAVFMAVPEVCRDEGQLLTLFRRIGAGGTPLSEPEQIYSAFKAADPDVRVIVEGIHRNVSAVFSPAQIITTVLRIANARAKSENTWVPGFEPAVAAFREKNPKPNSLAAHLQTLFARHDGSTTIESAFQRAKMLLQGERSATLSHFHVSDIVMANLPTELWQVLVFWCVLMPEIDQVSREEAVRFAAFWHFGVQYPEKAARLCFKALAQITQSAKQLPGKQLYNALAKDGFAVELVDPRSLREAFWPGQQGHTTEQSVKWLQHKDRFGDEPFAPTAARWWHRSDMLLWLQQDYLRVEFEGYRPLNDHEDDTPYDRDHIVPKSHWKVHGNTISDALEEYRSIPDSARWTTGDSIGNLRLVSASQNRHDGDTSIKLKMPTLLGGTDSDGGSPQDFCLSYDNAAEDWKRADGARDEWSRDRIAGFQSAIENRTHALYCDFIDTWEFRKWLVAE